MPAVPSAYSEGRDCWRSHLKGLPHYATRPVMTHEGLARRVAFHLIMTRRTRAMHAASEKVSRSVNAEVWGLLHPVGSLTAGTFTRPKSTVCVYLGCVYVKVCGLLVIMSKRKTEQATGAKCVSRTCSYVQPTLFCGFFVGAIQAVHIPQEEKQVTSGTAFRAD